MVRPATTAGAGGSSWPMLSAGWLRRWLVAGASYLEWSARRRVGKAGQVPLRKAAQAFRTQFPRHEEAVGLPRPQRGARRTQVGVDVLRRALPDGVEASNAP